jgi:hypothetical protein
LGKIWRNKENYKRLGKPLQERTRLNTISWDFSSGKIILEVLKISCTFKKQLPERPNLPKGWEKNSKTYKNQVLAPSPHSHRFFKQDIKGIWEK